MMLTDLQFALMNLRKEIAKKSAQEKAINPNEMKP